MKNPNSMFSLARSFPSFTRKREVPTIERQIVLKTKKDAPVTTCEPCSTPTAGRGAPYAIDLQTRRELYGVRSEQVANGWSYRESFLASKFVYAGEQGNILNGEAMSALFAAGSQTVTLGGGGATDGEIAVAAGRYAQLLGFYMRIEGQIDGNNSRFDLVISGNAQGGPSNVASNSGRRTTRFTVSPSDANMRRDAVLLLAATEGRSKGGIMTLHAGETAPAGTESQNSQADVSASGAAVEPPTIALSLSGSPGNATITLVPLVPGVSEYDECVEAALTAAAFYNEGRS